MNTHDSDTNHGTNVLVCYDELGLFEIQDSRLLGLISAARGLDLNEPFLSGTNNVCPENVACINGGCFTVNYTCPTQKVCGNFLC